MIGMVTPKVSRCDGGSKHGLESPQRHPKGTNLCVSPFANAQDPACGRIDVNVILKEVGMVGHERPALSKEIREPGNEIVKH